MTVHSRAQHQGDAADEVQRIVVSLLARLPGVRDERTHRAFLGATAAAARALTGARVVLLAALGGPAGTRVVVVRTDGVAVQDGDPAALESAQKLLAHLQQHPVALSLRDLIADPSLRAIPSRRGVPRPARVLPAIARGAVRGFVYLDGYPPRLAPGAAADVVGGMVAALVATSSFAAQRGAASQDEASELAVSVERERIARDLHDRVIQRLYATNLGLHSLRGKKLDPAAQAVVNSAVAGIDGVMGALRATLNPLAQGAAGVGGLRGDIVETVRDITGTSGIDVRVRILGLIDEATASPAAEEALSVLAEALSNAVRHAGATVIEVDVAVAGDLLTLTVADDGAGLRGPRAGHGLGNLRRRAELAGGAFSIRDRAPRGTELVWSVPLRSGRAGAGL